MNKKRPPEHPIVAHARRELRLAGAFNKNENYDGMIGVGTLVVLKTLVRYAREDPFKLEAMTMAFDQLVRGELMTPPTDNPDEWRGLPGADPMIWQNKRCPFYRSADHGKTWYHTSDPNEKPATHPSANHLTGEVPEDASIQKDPNSGANGENTRKTAASEESSSGTSSETGRGVDHGVASQSTQDPQRSEGTPSESADRKAA